MKVEVEKNYYTETLLRNNLNKIWQIYKTFVYLYHISKKREKNINIYNN